MSGENNKIPIDRELLVNLQNAKPEVRGTTLITYTVGGNSDL